MKLPTVSHRAHFLDASVAYAVFLGLSLFGLLLDRLCPNSRAVLFVVLLAPYPLVLSAAVALRATGHPHFPLGGVREAIVSYSVIWAGFVAAVSTWLVFSGEFGPHSAAHRLAKFFTYSVADPLAEEFVFRGLIQTALNLTFLGKKKIAGLQQGTLVAAALFSLMHLLNLAGNSSLPATLLEVITAFPAGVLFGYIYQRTQNIWYGVFLHGLSNLVIP
jgi:membrane protease YdiL (CAAX protease family)